MKVGIPSANGIASDSPLGIGTPTPMPDAPRQERRIDSQSLNPNGQPWRVPESLEDHSTPAFPIDVFPQWLRNISTELSASTPVPIDVPAVLALPFIGLAAGRRIRVRTDLDSLHPLNLSALVATASTVGSQRVLDRLVAPVRVFERAEAARAASAIAAARARLRLAKYRLARRAQSAAREPASDAAMAEIADLEAEVTRQRIPAEPSLFVADASPESLCRVTMLGWTECIDLGLCHKLTIRSESLTLETDRSDRPDQTRVSEARATLL